MIRARPCDRVVGWRAKQVEQALRLRGGTVVYYTKVGTVQRAPVRLRTAVVAQEAPVKRTGRSHCHADPVRRAALAGLRTAARLNADSLDRRQGAAVERAIQGPAAGGRGIRPLGPAPGRPVGPAGRREAIRGTRLTALDDAPDELTSGEAAHGRLRHRLRLGGTQPVGTSGRAGPSDRRLPWLVHVLAAFALMPVAGHPYDLAALTGTSGAWLRWGVPLFYHWKFGFDLSMLAIGSQSLTFILVAPRHVRCRSSYGGMEAAPCPRRSPRRSDTVRSRPTVALSATGPYTHALADLARSALGLSRAWPDRVADGFGHRAATGPALAPSAARWPGLSWGWASASSTFQFWSRWSSSSGSMSLSSSVGRCIALSQAARVRWLSVSGHRLQLVSAARASLGGLSFTASVASHRSTRKLPALLARRCGRCSICRRGHSGWPQRWSPSVALMIVLARKARLVDTTSDRGRLGILAAGGLLLCVTLFDPGALPQFSVLVLGGLCMVGLCVDLSPAAIILGPTLQLAAGTHLRLRRQLSELSGMTCG